LDGSVCLFARLGWLSAYFTQLTWVHIFILTLEEVLLVRCYRLLRIKSGSNRFQKKKSGSNNFQHFCMNFLAFVCPVQLLRVILFVLSRAFRLSD
jgi:hypothetical protein